MTYWQSGRLARREAKLEKVGNKPNGDRIYPQHLIAIAVAELQNAEIKWHRVENVSEIQKRLTTAYHLHLV